jgi:hypothetical protein
MVGYGHGVVALSSKRGLVATRAIWELFVEMGPRTGLRLVRIGHFVAGWRHWADSRMQTNGNEETHGPCWTEGCAYTGSERSECLFPARTGGGVTWDGGQRGAVCGSTVAGSRLRSSDPLGE